jgi:hypothetical protein
MKKLNFYILLSQLFECVEQLSLFCHLLESTLAWINWIQAVDKFCVEQLISCQKCRANDCRAIKFRVVDPHSYIDGPNKSKVVKKLSNTEMKVPFISQ